MSELENLRRYVEEELNNLQTDFEETARDAVELITDPKFALQGLPPNAPLIETDIPVHDVTIEDTVYSDALLHLAVYREVPEQELVFIGFAKKLLGPLPFLPFIRPPSTNFTPVAISATVRQKRVNGNTEVIEPLTSPMEVDMRNFDHDLYAQKLPRPEDMEICKHRLKTINDLMSRA